MKDLDPPEKLIAWNAMSPNITSLGKAHMYICDREYSTVLFYASVCMYYCVYVYSDVWLLLCVVMCV